MVLCADSVRWGVSPGRQEGGALAAVERLHVARAFARTVKGQIHYAECGQGKPVVLLHETPRSWDEYRDVLPLLGRKFRTIAMDMAGFGDSYRLADGHSIEAYARSVLDLMDALEIPRASVVGHHTGGLVALEVAASAPERVDRMVLSSAPYAGPERREARKNRQPIDPVTFAVDGFHPTPMWQKRLAFYPPERPDLLTRYMIDALRVLDQLEEGHLAVEAYRIEERLPLVRARTLVMAGSEDGFSCPHVHELAERLPVSRVLIIEGGTVVMDEQLPEVFASAVLTFLIED